MTVVIMMEYILPSKGPMGLFVKIIAFQASCKDLMPISHPPLLRWLNKRISHTKFVSEQRTLAMGARLYEILTTQSLWIPLSRRENISHNALHIQRTAAVKESRNQGKVVGVSGICRIVEL
jgi:hypothetical protein